MSEYHCCHHHGKKASNSNLATNTDTVVLLLEGMTCGGCVGVANSVMNSFDEVDSVVTDLQTGKSILSCNVHRLNLLPILTALDEVGLRAYLPSMQSFVPPPLAANSTNRQEQPQPQQPQTLGAIGRPTAEPEPEATVLGPPSPLSLMDELRIGSTPLRRYKCRRES